MTREIVPIQPLIFLGAINEALPSFQKALDKINIWLKTPINALSVAEAARLSTHGWMRVTPFISHKRSSISHLFLEEPTVQGDKGRFKLRAHKNGEVYTVGQIFFSPLPGNLTRIKYIGSLTSRGHLKNIWEKLRAELFDMLLVPNEHSKMDPVFDIEEVQVILRRKRWPTKPKKQKDWLENYEKIKALEDGYHDRTAISIELSLETSRVSQIKAFGKFYYENLDLEFPQK